MPIEALRSFSTQQEIEMLVCGQGSEADAAEWRDADFLRTIIIPERGFSQNSTQFRDFVRYITEIEPEDRKVFLNWITGSNRLPAGGFAALYPRMTLNRKQKITEGVVCDPDGELPTVNTCKHYVKMPEYSTYEVLKGRFDCAARDGGNRFDFN
jgi:E3 ubiquitin-protein ligase TRIP12